MCIASESLESHKGPCNQPFGFPREMSLLWVSIGNTAAVSEPSVASNHTRSYNRRSGRDAHLRNSFGCNIEPLNFFAVLIWKKFSD